MPSAITDSAALSADQQSLNDISKKVVSGCPDMREMARDAACEILRKFGLGDLEPDTVYWHRFDRSHSSPRTFNGWAHEDAPVESLTLPQLVMQRFSASTQDSADDLQTMSGFYTANADAQVFDETNEVRLLPKDMMDEFWSLDFKTRFTARMNAFWNDCAGDFRTLAKANFIAKAMEDHRSGALSDEQYTALMSALGMNPAQPINLGMLLSQAPHAAGVRVASLDIAGYAASDILRIVEASGRQFLYVPGEVDAFHVFNTPDELHWWLMTRTNEPDNRARFMSHFPLSTHAQSDHQVGLHHALDLMFSHWGGHGQPVVNRDDGSIAGDPFNHLRDATQRRMQADAEFALRSNGQLRKQMWMADLRAFGEAFGALAALDWPIALAAVGAGLADVGLNIDQAVNGHTTAERKSGVIGAILGSIDVLFNGLFVAQGLSPEISELAVEAEPIGEPAQTGSIDPLPQVSALEPIAPAPAAPTETIDPLATFETNELLDSYPSPATQGTMRGIYQMGSGETYVNVEGIAYQVRYVSEMDTWVIVDPQNPYSFSRNIPVRLNAAGEWQPMIRQGLRGGGGTLGKLPAAETSVSPSSTALPTPYDMPQDLREPLRAQVENPSNKPFTGQYLSFNDNDPIYSFFDVRRRLHSDVEAFYASPQLPERPPTPALAAHSSPKAALKQLYENARGVVIGESHDAIASKQLLIDNIALLAKQKIRTLYMEHLLTDLHQADLDTFANTGTMPEKLEAYLVDMDRGHRTDSTGTYTFLNLVKAANKHHLRIRAIDCMASYRVAGLPDARGTLRIKMMNYFAKTVIQADQAALGESRWIALVGEAHANTFEGVPGLAELEGVSGLCVRDVSPGEAVGFDVDPGEDVRTAMGKFAGTAKSDLRLRMAVNRRRPTLTPFQTSIESRLRRAGNFVIKRLDNAPELIHRSRNGSLVHTPITRESTRLFIQRPEWPLISGRRYNSFEELADALKLMGLTQVG